MQFNKSEFINEFLFTTSRSSGKGGQHANKNESRVSLFFYVKTSLILNDEQKQLLIQSPKVTLSKEGVWQIDVEESKSQIQNKKIAINRFFERLEVALTVQKKRKISKPTKASIKKRLQEKKIQAQKKSDRKFKNDKL